MHRQIAWLVERAIACLITIALCGTAWARPEPLFDLDAYSAQTSGIAASARAAPAPEHVLMTAAGGAWTSVSGTVRHFLAAGQPGVTLDFGDLRSGSPLLAIDPFDDSLWTVTPDGLFNVGTDGSLRRIAAIPAATTAIAVALDQTVWIAVDGGLLHLDRDGRVIGSHRLASGRDPVIGLAVDSLRGRVWVVRDYAVDVIDDANSSMLSLAFDEPIRSASLDPRLGNLWTLKGSAISIYDSGAQLSASIELGVDDFDAIAYDAQRDLFVLASAARWLAIDRQRAVVHSSGVFGLDDSGVIAPFRLLPELASLHPLPERTALDVGSSARLEFAASCNGARCNVGAEYLSGFVLSITVEGIARGADDIAIDDYDPVTGQVVLATTPAFPAGVHTVTIRALDRFGHVSNAVELLMRAGNDADRGGPLKANQAPAVALTAPANNTTFLAGSSIVLNAAASDTDGTVAKVEFFRSGVSLGVVAAPPYTVSWPNAAAGAYALTAKATDDKGATRTSGTVSVVVKANVAPFVVLTSPAPCSEVTSPTDVTLSADAVDTDGTVSRVDFFNGTTLLASASAPPYSFRWLNPAAGAYSLRAVAVDERGDARSSNAVAFNVLRPNVPPAVTMTQPVAGSRYGVGAPIPLGALATDADGTIKRVEFHAGGALIATSTAPPFAGAWTNASAGNHLLTAKAFDDRGAATISASVGISVIGNALPVVSLAMPAGGPTFMAPANVTLAATATDSDGTIRKVEFFAGTGSSVPGTLIGTVTAQPFVLPFTIAQPGTTYNIMARATDDLGGAASSGVITLRTNSPPVVSIVSPADNAMVYPGPGVTIVVKATDSDGGIQTVAVEGYVDGVLHWNDPVYTRNGDLFTFRPASFPPGSTITLIARATDTNGVQAYGKPVRINTAPRPVVRILTPVAGDGFVSPATIRLTATASQPLGKIVKVNYYADNALIGSATSAPYTFDWTDVASRPNPNRTLRAEAVDSLGSGGTGRSPDVVVSVEVMRLAITSPPVRDMIVYTNTLEIKGTYSAVTPDSIKVNGVPATFGNGTFSITMPLVNGLNGFVVIATTGDGTVTKIASVYYYRPSITMTSPELDARFESPATVDVAASIQGFQRPIDRVEFWASGTMIAKATAAPYAAIWQVTRPGNYTLSAKAVDVDGTVATTPYSINVSVAYPPGVSFVSPPDNSVVSKGSSVEMRIHAKAATGNFSTLELTQNNILIVSTDVRAYQTPELNWHVSLDQAIPGTYIYVAKATDDSGRVWVSPPIRVEVSAGASVSIVLPKAGTTFKSPAQIKLGAVTGVKSTTRVEFLANGTLVASATTRPFVATWTNVPDGTYELVAKAIDVSGPTTSSATMSITVGPAALNIDTPADGEVVYGPTVVVGGEASGTAANPLVTVNGVTARTGSGTYAATVPLNMGSNTLTVTATIGSVTRQKVIQITRAEPSVDFENVRSGDVLADDTVPVRGRVQAPPNSGLLIGQRPIEISADGGFHLNDVALSPGTNAITARLMKQDGTFMDSSLTGVTRNAIQPFQVVVTPSSGLDYPLHATMTLTRRAPVDYNRLVLTENGVTLLDEQVAADKDHRIYSLTFNDLRAHRVTTTLFDAGGAEVYSRTATVRASSPDDVEQQIRDLFNKTLYRLLAGDITSAVSAFSADARPYYHALFTELGPNLPRLTDALRTIDSVTYGANAGEIVLIRTTSAGPVAHPISVARDEHGIWRLSGI